ncbi:hypothetical protein FGG08_003779 [Glutinoglossum americanum]|uniref:DUF7587 domain-containing protein n=1 Tax=Glutinoglossum americanum TaxID=1670608 RepID=A0A9P8I8W6_9PEZI|nr:hypothetical protein FGG08_003779 [Glutinoglossum americanum]
MQEHVLTPFVSLTNSPPRALDWMRSINNKGATDIELYLIDTRKIPYDHISPAWVLKEYCKVPNCGKVWHDDPAHELLVYYHIPEEAVTGKAKLDDVRSRLRSCFPASFEDQTKEVIAPLKRFRASLHGKGSFISSVEVKVALALVCMFTIDLRTVFTISMITDALGLE